MIPHDWMITIVILLENDGDCMQKTITVMRKMIVVFVVKSNCYESDCNKRNDFKKDDFTNKGGCVVVVVQWLRHGDFYKE